MSEAQDSSGADVRTIRIAVVDDHQLIREGLCTMASRVPGVEVIASGGTGADALLIAREQTPDIMMLDIELPDMSGVDVARQLKSEGSPVHIVGLSAYTLQRYVYGILDLGAAGFVRKEEMTTTLLTQLVRDVAAGSVPWVSPELGRLLVKQRVEAHDARVVLDSFTDRERDAVTHAALGENNAQIADRLSMTETTARNHVDRARSKVGVKTRAELVAWAWKVKLVTDDGRDWTMD